MDANLTQVIVAVIAALSGGGVIIRAVDGFMSQRSGRFEMERKRGADILALRDRAVADAQRAEDDRRSTEVAYRADRDKTELDHRAEVRLVEAELRVISYHAQILTRMLIEAGCDPSVIPRWPVPERRE